jgi:undecaprenyl-diphosphatase
MDSVIVAAAEYLIYAMIIGFGLVWVLAENRRGKVQLAFAAAIGALVVLVMIKVTASLYYDPRPLVAIANGGDGVTPLFAHDPDNGFPSDHSALAGLMTSLVLLRRRWIAGIWFALGAAAVAWARVAAGVHHLLDVVVGLGLGAVAAVIGVAIMTLLLAKTPIGRVRPLGRWLAADPALNVAARHRPDPNDSPAAGA